MVPPPNESPLHRAEKLRGMNKINQWANNTVNHFWFCCSTCDGDV